MTDVELLRRWIEHEARPKFRTLAMTMSRAIDRLREVEDALADAAQDVGHDNDCSAVRRMPSECTCRHDRLRAIAKGRMT